MIRWSLPAALLGALLPLAASAQTSAPHPVYGPRLEGFEYPHPVAMRTVRSQGQDLEMAYMDVAPVGEANGRAVVLLHGKNFCGATWERTIAVLTETGYRVLAPDQIGFCKSSKPAGYQFSFPDLATHTNDLVAELGIEKPVVVGHSMGGMLAARYALMFPDDVGQLVLVNPIGLEDWQAKGVPYQTLDDAYEGELKTSFDSIKAYQQRIYYNGAWKPDYDRWVEMLAGMYAGDGRAIVARNQAQTSDMVFTQPVVHEFARIAVPTVLMIGGLDRTAPGGNRASKDIAETLGQYPALGRQAAEAIPDAALVEFPELGHSPQVEAPEPFQAKLLEVLGSGRE
ncbi:alpha/beta fold hydrolase [Aureimonas phyllosphaerae]|uniref:Pimeloyl-ACP methyl ester carboxylesterase n=1 Tax=Aureimonas phyllosphaerae TaxID=1166078 RepID=A0A7W6BYW5_9HYPH|nr:alpha/beta hydrolase [Aureimonas phyllosphaerae]MBB3937300.1 pimeloyl-ACP methyl ester carboxylesterase [Aureimonas phyllosphaerae]MBB3961307.1 pimeloyl-ACP methyl ester carboxylesterase [Aureimonas phyllosphaerae]SFF41680.1 Pimeloyl-ACP methyl ester carboxylesterase [Aureimonas phyllosphaerae]